MSTIARVTLFVAGLAALFGVAWGVGNALDTVEAEPTAHVGEHGTSHGAAQHLPQGLMVSQDGYTLEAPLRGGVGRSTVGFRIIGPDGEPVTTYEVQHDKQLHLIVVRRDFAGFQHVHPTLDAEGTWHVDVDLTPGTWRLFADFKPTGAEALTLGSDLVVAGQAEAVPRAMETRTAEVDGYTVTLDGDLEAGEESTLTLTVSKDGQPVTTEPYLGAAGHLVALREGDLAYLHVHPEGDGLRFVTAVPSAGGYRLFLDFKHDGVVRTAAFALTAGGDHADH